MTKISSSITAPGTGSSGPFGNLRRARLSLALALAAALPTLGCGGADEEKAPAEPHGEEVKPPAAHPEKAAPAPQTDPFEMGERCPWYTHDKQVAQWTGYLVLDDGRLVYFGIAPEFFSPGGAPVSMVHLAIVDGKRVTVLMQRFPRDMGSISDVDLDVRVGTSRLVRNGDTYDISMEVTDRGHRARLDATFTRIVAPCGDGGDALVSLERLKNHFEYEVTVPRATLSGTLTIDDAAEKLAGSAYLESIRWLRSKMERPCTWLWGFAYPDPYAVLFFIPDYPESHPLLYVWKDGTCLLDGLDAAITHETRGDGHVVLTHESERVQLELVLDGRKPNSSYFPIFPTTYEARLKVDGQAHKAKGTMIFERGEWTHF